MRPDAEPSPNTAPAPTGAAFLANIAASIEHHRDERRLVTPATAAAVTLGALFEFGQTGIVERLLLIIPPYG